MIRTGRFTNLAALATFFAMLALTSCARDAKVSSAGEEGHVKLALSVPGGLTVNSVTYVVKSSTGTNLLGPATFDVSDPNATPSLDVVLPASTGNTITLSAVATNGRTFTGTSTAFNIVSGQTTVVSVTLTDTVAPATPPGQVNVNGTIVAGNSPPVITSVVVAPAQTSVNANISVTVAATDPDTGDVVSYAWTATPNGAFANPAAATTTFSSPTAGTKTLRITVSDNHTPPATTFVDLPVNIIGVAGASDAGSTPSPDAGVADTAAPTPDAATPSPDVATPAPDVATGTPDTATPPVDTYLALQNAELGTSYDPNLLTFTHEVDPDTGDSTPIGWGPRTLPTQAQRDAATALVRKIASLLPNSVRNASNTANYESTGLAFPALGLLTLGADPGGLISGSNLAPASSTAWAEYKAAAIADAAAGAPSAAVPGGVAATAADAAIGSYIATYAVNPASAIGIANNVVSAALQNGLKPALQAF